MKKLLLAILIILINISLAGAQTGRLRIYHFHVKERCPSDERIEKMTISLLDSLYKKEVGSRKIVRKSVNFDLKKNAKLAKKYKVTTIALIFALDIKGVETVVDLTDWAFANAFDEAKFKKELAEKINEALSKISQ